MASSLSTSSVAVMVVGSALQTKGTSNSAACSTSARAASLSSHRSILGSSFSRDAVSSSGYGGQHFGRSFQTCCVVCSTVVEDFLPESRQAERRTRRKPEVISTVHLDAEGELEVKGKESKEERSRSRIPAPSAFEVQSLLMELCDETSVAELKLKVGDFQLHVRRDVGGKKSREEVKKVEAYTSPMSAPHVPGKPMIETLNAQPASADGIASRSASAAAYASTAEEEYEEDEGLLHVISPKVGVFRRGRLFKGKRGRPMVNEGQMIKTKQVIGYLEQLGTQQPIESEHAGEVIRFPVEDGEPVGYGERLVEIRPSFPGIKKLTS